MKKEYYPTRKTFVKYDDEHYLLYLNEEIVDDYLPENAEEGTVPITAYAYSGTEGDGSTKIKATDATYAQFVSGLIRTQYSADDVEAIVLNVQSNIPERMDEFQQKMDELNEFRQQCKDAIAQLILE